MPSYTHLIALFAACLVFGSTSQQEYNFCKSAPCASCMFSDDGKTQGCMVCYRANQNKNTGVCSEKLPADLEHCIAVFVSQCVSCDDGYVLDNTGSASTCKALTADQKKVLPNCIRAYISTDKSLECLRCENGQAPNLQKVCAEVPKSLLIANCVYHSFTSDDSVQCLLASEGYAMNMF